MKKKITIILTIMLLLALFAGIPLASASEKDAEQEKYKEVVVNAVWIPIDKDTGEVYDDLTPLITHPNAYDWSEVAELQDDPAKDYFNEYVISYMGTRIKNNSYYLNNFMYTSNLFFSDRFHKVVAQGCSTSDYNIQEGKKSPVRKLVYGSFEDEDLVMGLHGMTMTPFQEGEILELYIDTIIGNTSLSEADFVEDELTIQRPKDIRSLIDLFKENIKEYTFLSLDKLEEYIEEYVTIDDPKDMNWDKVYLYKYDPDNRDKGEYLKNNNGDYLNIINELDINDLELGEYEVVIPVYWQRMVPEALSAPDTFSRNRYKYDDTIHFTLILEERDGADVIVKYVDEEGNQLADQVILKGKVNESWTTEAKEIEGWILKTEPENSQGTFTDEVQEVVYIYEEEIEIQDPEVPGGPTDPTGPEEPEEPEEPGEPEDPLDDSESEEPETSPKTGDTSLVLLYVILMILTGSAILIFTVRKALHKQLR
jgi:uncharacterized surface anchored protein